MALFASLATSIVTKLLDFGFSGLVDRVLKHYEVKAASTVESERIAATVKTEQIRATVQQWNAEQETRRAAIAAGTQRQIAKFNYPIFWFLIAAGLGPGLLMIWALLIYNILFWKFGIWPQAWQIAAFPPQAERWVNMSIEWLFDPLGVASTVGAAIVAGKAAK